MIGFMLGKKSFGIAQLFAMLTAMFQVRPNYAGGSGTFDSRGGSADYQTEVSFFKRMYMEARTRTVVGPLSKASDKVADMLAGGPAASLDGSAAIVRQQITEGDEMRFTMQEHFKGMPSYGDLPVKKGDFLAYKNMVARVNQIDSPAFQIPGKQNQQRVKASITNIPKAVEQGAIDYTAEQMEYEFFIACLYGASPAVLNTTANGGLGISLGCGSGGGAGVPLLPRHVYTPQGGFLTYNTTPATWNGVVNDAVNAITQGANGMLSLAQLLKIRHYMDANKFQKIKMLGKEYKSIVLVDSTLWYRLDNLLKASRKDTDVRGDDSRVYGVDYKLEYNGFLFLNVPNLDKFRFAYNASTGIPDIGPGLTSDPRTYTNSSMNGTMIFMGAGAVIEGYNGQITITKAEADHEKGLEVSAHVNEGFVRGEWYAKDGRTDATAVANYSMLVASFYDPGVGSSYL